MSAVVSSSSIEKESTSAAALSIWTRRRIGDGLAEAGSGRGEFRVRRVAGTRLSVRWTMRGGGECENRSYVAAHLLRREAAGGQFDGEGGGAGQVVVLPVRGGPGQPVVVIEAHPGRACVHAPGSGARAPGPDEVHVLVEPDRDAGTDVEDQVARDPRLPLRERPRARVVDVPGTATAAGSPAWIMTIARPSYERPSSDLTGRRFLADAAGPLPTAKTAMPQMRTSRPCLRSRIIRSSTPASTGEVRSAAWNCHGQARSSLRLQYRSSSSPVSVEFESVGQDSVGSASIALRCFSSSGLW